MLKQEAQANGSVDILEIISSKGANEPNPKLDAIQALANTAKTGDWNERTLHYIETNLLAEGYKWNGTYALTAEQIAVLAEREKQTIGREFGKFLENGGSGLILGSLLIGGAIAYNAATGKYSCSTSGGAEGKAQLNLSRDVTKASELDTGMMGKLKNEGTISGGGRSGGDRPLTGTANSYVKTDAGHTFVYDGNGRLIYDITPSRVKMTVWDEAPNGNLYNRDIKLEGQVPSDLLK